MENKQRQIAYRCPECGSLVRGIAGKFALSAKLLRLKCPCGASSMDVNLTDDGKIRLSVPCLLCKSSHNFVIAQSIFFEKDIFLAACPYSGMEIGFIGEEDRITEAAKNAGEKLGKMMDNLGLSEMREMQPQDLDRDDILPDATLWDLVNFVVRDLEDDQKIDCPCHRLSNGNGSYELRFTDDGIQCYCPDCGATYLFRLDSPAASEEYLKLDGILLK